MEIVRDLVLDGAHEQLLARVADEVVVGVPVADELERRAAGHFLVAGLEVDRRVLVVAAGVLVEVAAVDVDPDPAELVDDLREADEVDGHEVVDPEPRQRLDGLDRALRAAIE